MAETAPPGNPCATPQLSRMNCEVARLSSCVCAPAGGAHANKTAIAIARRTLREVYELLNDDLGRVRERKLRMAEHVQGDAYRLAARRRDARRELVLRNRRTARRIRDAAPGAEDRAARFPAY